MSTAVNPSTVVSKKQKVALKDSSKLQLIHRQNSQASVLSAVSNTERHST